MEITKDNEQMFCLNNCKNTVTRGGLSSIVGETNVNISLGNGLFPSRHIYMPENSFAYITKTIFVRKLDKI